jgi:signal transduction histidine kinase
MLRPPLRGLTIQASLVLGFLLTAAVWVYTGYDFASRMAAVEDRTAAITARYMQAQEQLSAVRAQLLAASVYVRDALLDQNPQALATYRRQLDATYATIERAFEQYVPILGTDAERRQVDRLRTELDEFRRTTDRLLQARKLNQSADARILLNKEVVPRREAAIRVSEEMQSLNRAAFVHHQTEIAALHRQAERETWQRLGLALLVSAGIGLLASLYTGRLESKLRAQMTANEESTRYLQQLSTRLISAQEQERQHIARELHDEVGQALTAVKVELSVAQRTLEAAGWPSGLLDDAQSIAHSALHSVRDLSQVLHPALLDDLGLSAAVEWQANAFAKRYGVKVDVEQENMRDRLSADVELAAYRIVQEALTNVGKHADATTCRVVLRRRPGDLEILVEDDGTGFDPQALPSGHRGLGLVGMHERAAQFAGRLALQTARGAGTQVRVRLALKDAEYFNA